MAKKKYSNGIYKDEKTFKYNAYISLGSDPITHKRIRKHIRGYATLKEIEYAILQFRLMYLEGENVSDLRIPFKNIYASFMIERNKMVDAGELTIKTQYDYEAMCNLHIFPYFENVENVKDLKIIHFDEYIQHLKNTTPLSNTRINKTLMALNQMFTHAQRNELIKNNPLELVKKLKKEQPKEKEILSPTQFIKLLNNIEERKNFRTLIYKTTLAVNYGCGFRLSEIAGIKKTDIIRTGETMQIKIERSLQALSKKSTGKSYIVGKVKTVSANRTIAIPKFTQELIEEALKQSPKHFEWLFQLNEDKPPYNQDAYNEFLKRACAELELPIITSHNLRHSLASLLLFESNDEITIKKRMGHAKIYMTKNTYGHSIDHADVTLANIVNNHVKI